MDPSVSDLRIWSLFSLRMLHVDLILPSNTLFSGINAAATFNRTIMRKRGVQLGEEFRGKGVNVALSPAMYGFFISLFVLY